IPVQQNEARVERHFETAIPPQEQRGRSGHKTGGGEDTLPGEKHEHHHGEHQQSDKLGAHASVSPLAFARSLKKVAITCNRISAIPMHMMILMGAKIGAHEE